MRVIAGRYKGRKLRAPAGRSTRPTADRVREAVFSMLGPLDGLAVLDLFAGSGALGIESLSRGAASAVFVDSDPGAVAAITANLEAVGVEATVHRRDALAFLANPGARFDVVFLDPPYSASDRLETALAQRLPPVLEEEALIVTESDKHAPLELPFPLVRERSYGGTRIAIHRG